MRSWPKFAIPLRNLHELLIWHSAAVISGGFDLPVPLHSKGASCKESQFSTEADPDKPNITKLLKAAGPREKPSINTLRERQAHLGTDASPNKAVGTLGARNSTASAKSKATRKSMDEIVAVS